MPVIIPPNPPAAPKFILRIGGMTVQDKVPIDGDGITPLSYSLSSEASVGSLSFTIEDPSATTYLNLGAPVELIDNRTGSEVILWGGNLVEAVIAPAQSNRGRLISCTATAYDAWLEWRVVTRWRSTTDTQKLINRLSTDRQMVQALITRFGAGLQAPDATVSATNTNMPNVAVIGMTLRDSLQAIAEAATTTSDTPTRYFYVDPSKRLHWYKETENLVAPYFVTDDIYTRRIKGVSSCVAFWRMTEISGTTATDVDGGYSGTYTGGFTLGSTGGITNEPYMTAVTLNGSTGYVTASNAALHPGDTFSVEIWYKRGTTGSLQTLWSGGTGDIEIGFDASDRIVVNKEGTGAAFTSTNAYTDTASWHQLVVLRSPGATSVMVDGVAIAGTSAAQTFVAAAGAINIGRRLSATDRYFNGSICAVSLYNANIGAVEAARHYSIGDGINPANFSLTLSAYDGREEVYIAGSNASGTGWVRERDWLINTAFARASDWGKPEGQPARQEIVDREDSDTSSKRTTYGKAFLRRHSDPTASGSFEVTGYDGWKVGQLLYVYQRDLDIYRTPDDGLGYPFEITDVQTSVGMGNGKMTHTISFGQRRIRGTKILMKRRRR